MRDVYGIKTEKKFFAMNVCVGGYFWVFLALFVLIRFQYPVTIFSLPFLVTREGES